MIRDPIAVLSVIARDDSGLFLGASATLVSGIVDPLIVETVALLEGI